MEEARRLLALLALELSVVPPAVVEAPPEVDRTTPTEAARPPAPGGPQLPAAARVHDLMKDFGSEGF